MKSAVAIILANLKSNIGDFAILHAILLDLQQKYPGRALDVFPLGHYQIDEGRIAAFREACNVEFELAGKTYSSEMDAKLLQEKFLRLVGLWPLVQKRLVRSLAETVADDAMRFREYEAIFLAGGERGGGTRGGVSLFATLEAVQRHNDRIYTFPFSITPQVLRFNTRSSLRRYFEKIKDPVLVRDSSSARFLERTGVRSVLGGDCVYSLEALAWQVSKKEGRDPARILLAFTGRRVESAGELTRALRRLTDDEL